MSFHVCSHIMNNIHCNIPSFVNSYFVAALAEYFIACINCIIIKNSRFVTFQNVSPSYLFVFENFAFAFITSDSNNARSVRHIKKALVEISKVLISSFSYTLLFSHQGVSARSLL